MQRKAGFAACAVRKAFAQRVQADLLRIRKPSSRKRRRFSRRRQDAYVRAAHVIGDDHALAARRVFNFRRRVRQQIGEQVLNQHRKIRL